MDYEEKISGLIDSAATSGLFVMPAAAVPSVAVVSTAGGEREAGAEGEGEQLRCMLRLSNERNEVLRGQMQQVRVYGGLGWVRFGLVHGGEMRSSGLCMCRHHR